MLKKYLITSANFYTHSLTLFEKKLREQLIKHTPEFVLYRDKSNQNYKKQAEVFVKVCREFKFVRGFLHGNYKLAKQLGTQGVHLTSQQFDEIARAKELELEVIVSTHTLEEVLEAKKLGADYVTYSPIFFTPNKGTPKGVQDLQNILNLTDIKVFALGGIIDKEQIDAVSRTDAYGFASIRYFEE